jgi:quercetin dioxygenase-like cupin family protein
MSSMNRVLEGDVLVHHLTEDERILDQDLLARHGRTARTIVKDGPLRLTLMGLAPGGVMPSHRTEAQVTVHVLEGEGTFTAAGREYHLKTADVLVFGPNVEHEVRSATGGVFLLTIVFLGDQSDGVPNAA